MYEQNQGVDLQGLHTADIVSSTVVAKAYEHHIGKVHKLPTHNFSKLYS